jgi:hypothetical protein
MPRRANLSNLGLCGTDCDARNVEYFVSVCTYNGYDKFLKALKYCKIMQLLRIPSNPGGWCLIKTVSSQKFTVELDRDAQRSMTGPGFPQAREMPHFQWFELRPESRTSPESVHDSELDV